MNHDVMVTKLLPPRIETTIIQRTRLLEILKEKESCKLILLSAPAGYGKSLLLRQYADTINTPVVWYQLDHFDNDPVVFLQYLISGIQQKFADFGKYIDIHSLINQGDIASRFRLVLVSLVNGLSDCATEGLVLVLDDYHVIRESVIHQMIQELITNLPAKIQLLISSRLAFPIPLARLRISGFVFELGVTDLCFTKQEIQDYLVQKQKMVDLEYFEAFQKQWV
jgi:ATP-dependent transcriptional regulator